MLPAASHPIWTRIATGAKPIQSDKLALNLLLKSNKLSYERDPSPANVKILAAKTHVFFTKYEKLYGGDLDKILA